MSETHFNINNVDGVAENHLQLGLKAERRSDWENAIEHYLLVNELKPSNKSIRYFGHNNLAYSLLHLGRFEEAETYCMKAIEVDDGRHNAYKDLGLACESLGRPIHAATCFINAAIMFCGDERAWLHLQKLLMKNPGLLDNEPALLNKMEVARKNYEDNDGVPVLN